MRYILKNYRLQNNYTQEYMALKLKMSRQQYSNIENGKTQKISPENKKKIVEVLDIPEELIDSNQVIIYTNNEGENYTANNAQNINYTAMNEEVLTALIEQNKILIELIKKINEKV